MSARRIWTITAATVLMFGAAYASEDKNDFSIELNDTIDIDLGCRLVYVAYNGTGQVLDKTSYEVYTFDSNGRVDQSLVFQFGSFPVGKTKVMQFDLPDQPCTDISRLLVNESTQCVVDGQSSTLCLDALKTTTRTPIDFGL